MNACSSALSPISVPHVSKSVGIGRGVQGVRPLGPRRCATLSGRTGLVAADQRYNVRSLVARAETDAQGYVIDTDGALAKLSLASFVLPIGSVLLIYGFGAYFTLFPGADVASLLLVYGFPATVLGFALKYAELAPVTLRSTPEAIALRPSQATEIQNQVRADCCRYRYGDEQHLDDALERVFQFNRPQGIPRRQSPTLVGLREESREGRYTLVMEFESPKLGEDEWEKRQPKFQSFFGPGIEAVLEKTDKGMDVALVREGK